MNSIKTLAGWQAAALSLAICVFFVAQHNTEHNGDLPALLVLGTTFGITLISALVAAITKSKTALYTMTAFLVAFAAVFTALANQLPILLLCFAVGFCFSKAIDKSNLKMSWVIPITLIEYSGVYWGIRDCNSVGFIVASASLIVLMLSAGYSNDKRALREPLSPAQPSCCADFFIKTSPS